MIKTNKKNQLCEILSQKKKKKKPKPNQTNVIVPCKLEEIFFQTKKKKKKWKVKSRERQKVGHWMENDNFVQLTLSHFLSILERLNCGGPREKIAEPHHFSLPLPLSTKHHFHSFSLLFSILP